MDGFEVSRSIIRYQNEHFILNSDKAPIVAVTAFDEEQIAE